MTSIRTYIMLGVFGFLLTTATFAQNYAGAPKEIAKLLDISAKFSELYVAGEYKALADYYTLDGKLIPERIDIIEGRKAIEERWASQKGRKILMHKMTATEIKILDDHAYDYGYYKGKTLQANGETSSWQGKYVIIWKKEAGDWKIYLDIWNSLNEPLPE